MEQRDGADTGERHIDDTFGQFAIHGEDAYALLRCHTTASPNELRNYVGASCHRSSVGMSTRVGMDRLDALYAVASWCFLRCVQRPVHVCSDLDIRSGIGCVPIAHTLEAL